MSKEYSREITLMRDSERLGKYIVVPWGEYRVSNLPIVSYSYNDSGAIALQKGGLGGLSHILSLDKPLPYVDGMIEEMECAPGELQAIVIMPFTLKIIKWLLERRGIKVVGSYRDRSCKERDVVVVPSQREVVTYTKKRKVVRRFHK